jgi:hypothetical protein
MTVKQVKSLIDFLANKYQLGYISGDEFNLTFRAAEMSHLSYLLGNTHQLQPGRPVPRFGLNMTKANTERLAPFRFTVSINSGVSGEIPKMSDVVAVEAMNRVDGVPLYYVAPNRVSEYVNSAVRDLTVDPIYTEYDTYFRTFPSSLDVVVTAIRVPPTTRWAYNVIDDVEVYDNTASSDPIWKPGDTLEIVGRMCKLIGVSLKDGELMNYGQSIINQGE